MSRPDGTTAAPSAPRFAMGWAALAYAICSLSLGWPALAGQFLVNRNSDQYIAGYAFREFAAASLRAGQGFPLWNPYQFGGMPYVAAMHGDIFYPTFLLRMLLPTDAAMTWGFILHVFLAGLFTFGFLRAVGVGFWGALVGGIAYMMSGNIAGLVSPGHDGKLYLSALLPLTLWLLHLGMRRGRAWSWGALAIVVGLAVLTPHPQLLQYLLLCSGAWGLFLAFSPGDDTVLPRPVAIRRLGLAALAVVIGGLIGAIQYLPVREYVPWSPRAGGKGWEHAVSYSLPTEEMMNFLVPQFTGILDRYWGRNGIHFHSEYIGATVLVLAGLAFGGWLSAARRKLVFFWLGVFVISLLWALGGNTPFYHIVYALVPGTKFFRAPSTMLYIVNFSVAVLAAIGLERVLVGRGSRRYLFIWIGVAALIGVLGATGALTELASSLAQPGREELVRENASALMVGAWRTFLVIALVAGALLAYMAGRIPLRAAAVAVALVVAADLWSILRSYWTFSPPASVTYASDATLDYLKKQEQPARVLSLALDAGSGRDPYIGQNANLMLHRIRQVLGYHGNELGRYDLLTGAAEGYRQIANPNLWALLNTQYFLTNVDSLPIPGATRVAGPARNAAGNMSYLFRLPGENPFAWIAPVVVKAADEATANTILDPRFDVRRAAIFDTSARVEARQVQTLPAPTGIPVRVQRYDPGHIALELAQPAPAGSALIASENYYPGWAATVDGRAAPIGRADLTLIGVPLPAGARRVELTFESVTYERGKWLTLCALLVAISLCVGGLVVDRTARG